MRLREAIISNGKDTWIEDFKIPRDADAKEYIEKIISEFNATRRYYEKERYLIEILDEKIDYSDISDENLIKLYRDLLNKQLRILAANKLDQIWGEYAQRMFEALNEFKIKGLFEDVLYLVKNIGYDLKLENLEEVLEEINRRGWKNIKSKVKKYLLEE